MMSFKALIALACVAVAAGRKEQGMCFPAKLTHRICLGPDLNGRIHDAVHSCFGADAPAAASEDIDRSAGDGDFAVPEYLRGYIGAKMCVFSELGYVTDSGEIDYQAVIADLDSTAAINGGDDDDGSGDDEAPSSSSACAVETCKAVAGMINADTVYTALEALQKAASGQSRSTSDPVTEWNRGLQCSDNSCNGGRNKCGMGMCNMDAPSGPVSLMDSYERLLDHEKEVIFDLARPLSFFRCIRSVVDDKCGGFIEKQLSMVEIKDAMACQQ